MQPFAKAMTLQRKEEKGVRSAHLADKTLLGQFLNQSKQILQASKQPTARATTAEAGKREAKKKLT